MGWYMLVSVRVIIIARRCAGIHNVILHDHLSPNPETVVAVIFIYKTKYDIKGHKQSS